MKNLHLIIDHFIFFLHQAALTFPAVPRSFENTCQCVMRS